MQDIYRSPSLYINTSVPSMVYLDFCFKTSIASNDLIWTLLEKANHVVPFFIVGYILGYRQI